MVEVACISTDCDFKNESFKGHEKQIYNVNKDRRTFYLGTVEVAFGVRKGVVAPPPR